MGILSKMGLNEKEITKNAKKMMVNMKWLYENYEKLRDSFDNQYVAIDNQEVIDNDKHLEHLIERLKKNYKKINHILIEPIHPKEFKWLLTITAL